MILIRKADERGHFDHGWLDTFHTFSFGDYHDSQFMGFRGLRVINEDRVQPGKGFGAHPHRDMEIVTYVLAGELTHADSMGNRSIIRPGDVQRMTAGAGIMHSEMNESATDTVHLLQIWILPDKRGLKPGYEQKPFPEGDRIDRFCLLVSRDGRDGSLRIHQDVFLYGAIIFPGHTLDYSIERRRHAWVQVAGGDVDLNGHKLRAGDGAAISAETVLTVAGREKAEILLFDLV